MNNIKTVIINQYVRDDQTQQHHNAPYVFQRAHKYNLIDCTFHCSIRDMMYSPPSIPAFELVLVS
jgi:hypothetical protein